MKILALDIGDRWIGTAISDALGITCRPYKTVEMVELELFLKQVIPDEKVETIVIGYPKTLKGKESEQTKKIVDIKNKLEKQFNTVKWLLWDERLSSKRAQEIIGRGRLSKEDKKKEHSIAAAFILQSYLDYKSIQKDY
ncbi:Holliday junction resolvase RuvX [Candidatus Babeliales bacterium]|nr:Holliday junction resolvase RuvX [Candidatus Babeliales bacterium]